MNIDTAHDELYIYSVDHVRQQVANAKDELGMYTVRFYAEAGRPSRRDTGVIEEFFYYPSGGTIRDRKLNILFYEPKLDVYHTSSR